VTTAFSTFSEPHAWLIRGLVEYGWRDATRSRLVPAGVFGGFDLSLMPGSQGREGVILLVPAVADGQRCHEDEVYSFEIVLTHNDQGPAFAVRSADCNYLHEFSYDPANPVWTAGYIHQALNEYVPGFVRWRLGGGELTWAQRQGVPTMDAEPCSASLATWLEQQIRLHQTLDSGPQQNWWTGGGVPGGTAHAPLGAIATMGNAAGTTHVRPEGMRMLDRPGAALSTMVWMHGIAACCAAVNIITTVALFGMKRPFALITSTVFILFVVGMTSIANRGITQYKECRGRLLPWVAIVYAGVVPVCFIGGLPVAVWAGMRWRDPRVKALRA